MGSDDEGYAVRLKLRHFLAMVEHPQHGLVDDRSALTWPQQRLGSGRGGGGGGAAVAGVN